MGKTPYPIRTKGLVISLAAKTARVKEPKRSGALVRQETIASYLFLLPSLIFFLGFVIYPMIHSENAQVTGTETTTMMKVFFSAPRKIGSANSSL